MDRASAVLPSQPYGLQEDLEWAVYVTLNERGGIKRDHWDQSPGECIEESLTSLDVKQHLEMLRATNYNRKEGIQSINVFDSLIQPENISSSEKSPEPLPSASCTDKREAGDILQEKLEVILTKKLGLTRNEVRSQMEEGMWLFCTLFPEQHEFEKDALVQLWMARDFIKNDDYKQLIRESYFDALVAVGCIEYTRTCFPGGKSKYRVNAAKMLMMSCTTVDMPLYLRLSSSELPKISTSPKLQNLSLVCDDVNESVVRQITKLEDLRALLLFPPELSGDEQTSKAKNIIKIPHDTFLNLKHLQILDLRGICIAELPSSIGKVKELRYLDLSYSRIELLPETIGCLENLLTLKLRGCESLRRLPKGLVKLTALRHLDLDVLCQLSFLPVGMGALLSLETLSAFLVEQFDGRRICELRYMNNLRGSFCISQLERVSSGNEAKEAALSNKKNLKKLELRWSLPRLTRNKEKQHDFKVLEQLCPPSSLTNLEISGYTGLKLPSWIGDSKVLYMLVTVTLVKCEHLKQLPSLGELPLLQILDLINIKKMKRIGSEVRGLVDIAFPSLERLTIVGMSNLETWSGVKEGDFPRLCNLVIEHCPKLVALPSLPCLHSLKQLEIGQCTRLSSWSQTEFPSSLKTLIVESCPSFKKRYSNANGKDRMKLKDVLNVWIDHEEIDHKI